MRVALTAYIGALLLYVSYVLELMIEKTERNVQNERLL